MNCLQARRCNERYLCELFLCRLISLMCLISNIRRERERGMANTYVILFVYFYLIRNIINKIIVHVRFVNTVSLNNVQSKQVNANKQECKCLMQKLYVVRVAFCAEKEFPLKVKWAICSVGSWLVNHFFLLIKRPFVKMTTQDFERFSC